MKVKMTIDEALAFADEWSRGMTLHENSQGARVVSILLAEEVRKLRAQAQQTGHQKIYTFAMYDAYGDDFEYSVKSNSEKEARSMAELACDDASTGKLLSVKAQQNTDNPFNVTRPDEPADYGHDNSVSPAYQTPYYCSKCGAHMGDTDLPKMCRCGKTPSAWSAQSKHSRPRIKITQVV